MDNSRWFVSTTSASTSSGSQAPRRCRVPGCPNQHCRLTTHINYELPTKRLAKHQRHLSNETALLTAIEKLTAQSSLSTISRDGVDGMPRLPIENCLNPELRYLFHHFFDSVFEGLANIFRGPSVPNMPEYKQRMLSTALNSESYCMGLIVQSQTAISMARRAASETRQSLSVYDQALTAFRKEVSSLQELPRPLPIELALLALCTLITSDAFHERCMALTMHWYGMQKLVSLRGGLHAVTVSLAYVVHVDRICAQLLNRPPAFAQPASCSLPLTRLPWSWYGSEFLTLNRDRQSPIFDDVLSHCLDTCDLIGLWETSRGHQPLTSTRPSHRRIPSLEYLYYMRNRVDEQFAVLHARFWQQDSRERCILWAARIVEYPFTWENHIPTLNTVICDRLTNILKRGSLLELWADDMHILTWILFALITVEDDFQGKDWVMSTLRSVIHARLGGSAWPTDWWQRELETLQGFVWRDQLNASRFEQICVELERNMLSRDIECVVDMLEMCQA